ncbi:hypothetical protein RIF29_23779 [Crotalaria pallida]|uniref:Cullin family profile domain-containing protein n=1 Tax=Crotalaria pallida TaxID=3830 RepID=A0AAN9F6G9_CROPI
MKHPGIRPTGPTNSVREGSRELMILTKLHRKYLEYGLEMMMVSCLLVKDMRLARDEQLAFKNHLQDKNINPGIELSLTALQQNRWPKCFPPFHLNLPEEMVESVQICKAFYEAKWNTRKFDIINSTGSCHVTGIFEDQVVELVVSPAQLTCSGIGEKLKLCHKDLITVLHTLSCAESKILNKRPDTPTILESDEFEFNSKFSDRRSTIQISLPLPCIADHDEKRIIVDDKSYKIDAAIMRIRKSRKTMDQPSLVDKECVVMLHITPDIKAIEERIQKLMELDYLEIDSSNNPNVIRYLP